MAVREWPASRVIMSRLNPVFDLLLEKAKLSSAAHKVELPTDLFEALREHVSNNMPLRLILLPEMRLIQGHDIVNHIVSKMIGVDKELLSAMERAIFELRRRGSKGKTTESKEEDAADDPWKAICQFLFQKFARYSILSHTWLRDGEIIYQDTLQEGWFETMTIYNPSPSFEKLKGFCEVTHQVHGITLAWIDSLCINKESSAELDEAIQSMYKWYEKSTICITYLGDTKSLLDMESDNWFRRGWTLQELIAPKNMQFYDPNWTRLASDVNSGNDKHNSEIQQIILRATGIKAEELVSFDPLTGSDVPSRMRWAASRKTTRGEDRAYSLMGIFGVNFSISYGEGAERAFFRLIEAIISSRHTSYIIQALHWAGKAVSDRIHTSRLIPSGPECYRTNLEADGDQNIVSRIFTQVFPTLSEPMALTHLGLRVRLLLVYLKPTNVQIRGFDAISGGRTLPEKRGQSTITLQADNISIGNSHKTVTVKFPVDTPISSYRYIGGYQYERHENYYIAKSPGSTTSFGDSLFLGVYTFREDQKNVYLPFSSCAFLLGIRALGPKFSIQDVSSTHFEPSAKIDTSDIVQLHSSMYDKPSSQVDDAMGFDTIDKELLEELNMKVINVYL